MEKLQNALQKARAQRSSPTKDRAGAVAHKPSGRRGSGHRWSEMAPLELDSDRLVSQRVVTDAARAEARHFDILRTKVVLQMKRMGWSRVAVTSPSPACGKTTTACNLALGVGRQQDLSAILFDLDLRRPGVAKLLHARPDHSISDVLDGHVTFHEQALRYRDNVAVSMSRERAHDPSRLLLQQGSLDVLDQIEEDYAPDMMLFDLPPLLVSDDARAFLKNVDCALIIARAERTTAEEIDACEKEIRDLTNVLGVVLNGSHFGATAANYGDYY